MTTVPQINELNKNQLVITCVQLERSYRDVLRNFNEESLSNETLKSQQNELIKRLEFFQKQCSWYEFEKGNKEIPKMSMPHRHMKRCVKGEDEKADFMSPFPRLSSVIPSRSIDTSSMDTLNATLKPPPDISPSRPTHFIPTVSIVPQELVSATNDSILATKYEKKKANVADNGLKEKSPRRRIASCSVTSLQLSVIDKDETSLVIGWTVNASNIPIRNAVVYVVAIHSTIPIRRYSCAKDRTKITELKCGVEYVFFVRAFIENETSTKSLYASLKVTFSANGKMKISKSKIRDKEKFDKVEKKWDKQQYFNLDGSKITSSGVRIDMFSMSSKSSSYNSHPISPDSHILQNPNSPTATSQANICISDLSESSQYLPQTYQKTSFTAVGVSKSKTPSISRANSCASPADMLGIIQSEKAPTPHQIEPISSRITSSGDSLISGLQHRTVDAGKDTHIFRNTSNPQRETGFACQKLLEKNMTRDSVPNLLLFEESGLSHISDVTCNDTPQFYRHTEIIDTPNNVVGINQVLYMGSEKRIDRASLMKNIASDEASSGHLMKYIERYIANADISSLLFCSSMNKGETTVKSDSNKLANNECLNKDIGRNINSEKSVTSNNSKVVTEQIMKDSENEKNNILKIINAYSESPNPKERHEGHRTSQINVNSLKSQQQQVKENDKFVNESATQLHRFQDHQKCEGDNESVRNKKSELNMPQNDNMSLQAEDDVEVDRNHKRNKYERNDRRGMLNGRCTGKTVFNDGGLYGINARFESNQTYVNNNKTEGKETLKDNERCDAQIVNKKNYQNTNDEQRQANEPYLGDHSIEANESNRKECLVYYKQSPRSSHKLVANEFARNIVQDYKSYGGYDSFESYQLDNGDERLEPEQRFRGTLRCRDELQKISSKRFERLEASSSNERFLSDDIYQENDRFKAKQMYRHYQTLATDKPLRHNERINDEKSCGDMGGLECHETVGGNSGFKDNQRGSQISDFDNTHETDRRYEVDQRCSDHKRIEVNRPRRVYERSSDNYRYEDVEWLERNRPHRLSERNKINDKFRIDGPQSDEHIFRHRFADKFEVDGQCKAEDEFSMNESLRDQRRFKRDEKLRSNYGLMIRRQNLKEADCELHSHNRDFRNSDSNRYGGKYKTNMESMKKNVFRIEEDMEYKGEKEPSYIQNDRFEDERKYYDNIGRFDSKNGTQQSHMDESMAKCDVDLRKLVQRSSSQISYHNNNNLRKIKYPSHIIKPRNHVKDNLLPRDREIPFEADKHLPRLARPKINKKNQFRSRNLDMTTRMVRANDLESQLLRELCGLNGRKDTKPHLMQTQTLNESTVSTASIGKDVFMSEKISKEFRDPRARKNHEVQSFLEGKTEYESNMHFEKEIKGSAVSYNSYDSFMERKNNNTLRKVSSDDIIRDYHAEVAAPPIQQSNGSTKLYFDNNGRNHARPDVTDTHSDSNSNSPSVTYKLNIQISDDVCKIIRHRVFDDLNTLSSEFLKNNHLKSLFRKKLVEQLKKQQLNKRKSEFVDIVDLMD